MSEIFAFEMDYINFRFPSVNIGIASTKLTLPLPITLLNFCRLLRPTKSGLNLMKHPQSLKSECIELANDTNPSVTTYFSKFLKLSPPRFEGLCMVTFAFDRNIVVMLSLVGFAERCIFQATYEGDDESSRQFAG